MLTMEEKLEDTFKNKLDRFRDRFSVHYYPSFRWGMSTVFIITGLLEKNFLDLDDSESIRDDWEDVGSSLKEAMKNYDESLKLSNK